MRKSEHFNLNLVEGTDNVNPLVQDVPNYEVIDEQLFKNQNNGICVATHLKNGTVHALNRTISSVNMFRFTATSDYEIGETFTVDGVQVTAKLTNGETLGNGAFVINTEVLCVLVGTLLTVFCLTGKVGMASDSEKLGGNKPAYYASQVELETVKTVAQGAGVVANDAIDNTTPVLLEVNNTSFGGTCYAHRIGKLVVGVFSLGNAQNFTSNVLTTLATGLPKPRTPKDATSVLAIGHMMYGTKFLGAGFSIYNDGALRFYPSATGMYGIHVSFCYVCE